MSDWNAEVYHRVSEPQFRWGLQVLAALELEGHETVVDAGCGTGRLTAELARRLPDGHVIAVDVSPTMLEKARQTLAPFGERVSFLNADLGELSLSEAADVVFSTATFHWVLDHDALFARLYRALRPGGRLHAQCGGEGNLERHLALARRELRAFAPPYPTNFAGAEASVRRLAAAGFEEPSARLVPAPTPFPDAASFRTFIEHVTLRTVVAELGEGAGAFLDRVVEASAPGYTLDYVRLELRGLRR